MSRQRIHIPGVANPTLVPNEAIAKELCLTRDTTEKMLGQVKAMREDLAENQKVLFGILESVRENTAKVAEAIEEMKEGRRDLQELREKGSEVREELSKSLDELKRNTEVTEANTRA